MRPSRADWVPPGAWLTPGYADQAHLTRECSDLSGLTPANLARVRRPWPEGREVADNQ